MNRRDVIQLLLAVLLRHGHSPRARSNRRAAARRRAHGRSSEGNRKLRPVAAFLRGACSLDWTEGRNVEVDCRWTGMTPIAAQQISKELVALQPDLILAFGSPPGLHCFGRRALFRSSSWRSPIRSAQGFVASLSRPGGNATGLIMFESFDRRNGSICLSRSCRA